MRFKHFFLAIIILICLPACNGKKNTSADANTVYEVESLFQVADQQIDEDVMIQGIVTHVCKHSGKKCFLTNEEGKLSVQVMAGGDISTFDQELVGSVIQVKGTLKEHRRPSEDINTMELETLEMQESGEASHDQCESALASIQQMREWMEANGKDYYAIYYIDGLAYEVVD